MFLKGNDNETNKNIHHKESNNDDKWNVKQTNSWTSHELGAMIIIPTVNRPKIIGDVNEFDHMMAPDGGKPAIWV